MEVITDRIELQKGTHDGDDSDERTSNEAMIGSVSTRGGSGRGRGGSRNGGNGGRPIEKCFVCGSPDHLKLQCTVQCGICDKTGHVENRCWQRDQKFAGGEMEATGKAPPLEAATKIPVKQTSKLGAENPARIMKTVSYEEAGIAEGCCIMDSEAHPFNSAEWLLNSGSDHHICNNLAMMHDVELLEHPLMLRQA